MNDIWIVAYFNTETGKFVPCYDCGLHRTQKEAETARTLKHDADGIPVLTIKIRDLND